MLEFFLKVLHRVSEIIGPALFIGNSALGRKVGGGEELLDMCRSVEGWRSWNHEERERARASSEFFLPVLWDTHNNPVRPDRWGEVMSKHLF